MTRFALVGLFASILLPGCINFERQTLVYRHYPGTDVVVIFQRYEGISGAGTETLTTDEVLELDSVVRTERTFFFMNWLIEYSREGATEMARGLQSGQPDSTDSRFWSDPEAIRNLIELNQAATGSITVRNGPFYLNADGKLSGVQYVTVREFSRILEIGNRCLRDQVRLHHTGYFFSERSDQLLQDAVAAKWDFIELQGNRFSLRAPLDVGNVKGYPDYLVDNGFIESGGRIVYENGVLTEAIGEPDAYKTTWVEAKANAWYTPSALPTVRERYGLEAGFDPDTAEREFLDESDRRYGTHAKANARPSDAR